MNLLAKTTLAAATAWAGLAGGTAHAEPAMVRAQSPQSLVDALDVAGFKPVLTKDQSGDPKIDAEITGYAAHIFFYGCDEETHDNCDSIQFSAGFDRKKPWNEKAANQLGKKFRYTTVWLDDEGDPYVTWDVVMGDGIPTKTFLSAVNSFGLAMDNVSSAAFQDD